MTRKRLTRRRVLVVCAGVVAVALAMLVELADSVRDNDALVRFDNYWLRMATDHRSPWITRVAHVASAFGGGPVVVVVVLASALALIARSRYRELIVVLASSIGVALLVQLMKAALNRPRPPVATQLVSAAGKAWPSGHTAQSVALYGALAWVVCRVVPRRSLWAVAWVLAGAIALAVGASRVYLGVHWPSDVLSGWILGAGWLVAVIGLQLWLAPEPEPNEERRGISSSSGARAAS